MFATCQTARLCQPGRRATGCQLGPMFILKRCSCTSDGLGKCLTRHRVSQVSWLNSRCLTFARMPLSRTTSLIRCSSLCTSRGSPACEDHLCAFWEPVVCLVRQGLGSCTHAARASSRWARSTAAACSRGVRPPAGRSCCATSAAPPTAASFLSRTRPLWRRHASTLRVRVHS